MNTERLKKGVLLKKTINEEESSLIRVVCLSEEAVMTIDCKRRSMPQWDEIKSIQNYEIIEEEKMERELSPDAKRKAYERYNMISSILPYIGNVQVRAELIRMTAEQHGISEQTIRKYICDYLVANDILALAPSERAKRELTTDEKIMRKSLNKWYYTTKKRSLKTCYTLMLEKYYCDEMGQLIPKHPTLYQFRYFYRKYNQKSKEYISRNGMSFYQRNQRPLIGGDGVQGFAGTIGMGMLDSTVADCYVCSDAGLVAGRPELTFCVDAFTGLICGYSVGVEGGIYAVRDMLLNVITDKVEWCRRFGIDIKKEQWPCCQMPLKIVTDQGGEYKGSNLEQIADLGVELINLKSYRAELKGPVEKAFDIIQGYMEPYLKGYGYVEPDFQERGAHDYRKDACLTLRQYETILLHCIIFYNSNRVIEDYRMTEEMLMDNLKPVPCELWNWAEENYGSNLRNMKREQLIQVLLPRTGAKFTRHGLKVNGMFYHNRFYQEEYLDKKEVTVAFDPDSSNNVFLIEHGSFIRFELVQTRYKNKTIEQVNTMRIRQKKLVRDTEEEKTQAEIDLARSIHMVLDTVPQERDYKSTKHIRDNRQREKIKQHKSIGKELLKNE